MPSAEISMPVLFYPCRTRAEIDESAWEIFDDLPGHTANTARGFDGGGAPMIFLEVIQGGVGVVAKANLGEVLVKGIGWELLTAEQAEDRGLPPPATEQP